MAECRYYAMCDMCDRAGDDWLPCDGTDDGTVCGHFEPMPDVGALLELADEIEYGASSDDGEYHDLPAIMVAAVARKQMEYAFRIRRALGVQDG